MRAFPSPHALYYVITKGDNLLPSETVLFLAFYKGSVLLEGGTDLT